ncbi:M15 family metallopeptidase [Nocardioides hankookensis]|uniref:M15 family metallopeptidase n=1 Tax=Nocardioides hankookensis TaxID=443157 RepID=A0ABW1LIY8_9ACTN
MHHHPSGPLVAALLVLALATSGCGIPATGGSDDDDVPTGPIDTGRRTVSKLDHDLLAALQDAARDAQEDGIELVVTSGWRSKAHQRRLLAQAVTRYGSEAEARRYVATPRTSAHVTGDAVDVGPTDGAYWLDRHGADYGLCQVFANEIWHFELATSPGGECPALLPDGASR